MKFKPTQENIDYIKTHTAEECARYFDLQYKYIYRLCSHYKIKCLHKTGRYSEKYLSRAKEMAAEVNNSSVIKVAVKYGISKQAVSQLLRRAGYVHLFVKQENKK
jgi:hypothetical protein